MEQQTLIVMRDGQLDRSYYIKSRAKLILKIFGRVGYNTLKLTVDAIDELVEASKA